jgi:hypothetical protein
MDFVQRAKALLSKAARKGALQILPLAAAAALSVPSAHANVTFQADFADCVGGTMDVGTGSTIGGVTGIKLSTTSGSCHLDAQDSFAQLNVGASGSGIGDFPAGLTQLLVSFEFTPTSSSISEIAWMLDLNINGFGFETPPSGVTTSGTLVTGSALLI